MNNTVLVHVGKCGGSTCRTAISSSGVRIDRVVHIRQPTPDNSTRYFIIARAPIARAVSAFNWRYRLVNDDARQADRFPGERAILAHYGSLNGLAEKLYFSDGTDNAIAQGNLRSIHHLGESIGYYLDPLLSRIEPCQVAGVVMQETLDSDLRRLFGVASGPAENSNRSDTRPEMLALSAVARSNLQRFLWADFASLEILRTWGKINPRALAAIDSELQD